MELHLETDTDAQSEKQPTPMQMVSSINDYIPLRSPLTTATEPEAGQKEIFTSWSLLILIVLLIVALFTSYLLQTRKIQAVHETVLSIFAGTTGRIL